MPTPQEIQTRFWKALKSDRTLMLGSTASATAMPSR